MAPLNAIEHVGPGFMASRRCDGKLIKQFLKETSNNGTDECGSSSEKRTGRGWWLTTCALQLGGLSALGRYQMGVPLPRFHPFPHLADGEYPGALLSRRSLISVFLEFTCTSLSPASCNRSRRTVAEESNDFLVRLNMDLLGLINSRHRDRTGGRAGRARRYSRPFRNREVS
ncbi:hypothetical protein BC826DRAFT_79368 [Russula brevipes]|nr:hypothetical protein BC826DRAFT_79368 [Russula brevipes]